MAMVLFFLLPITLPPTSGFHYGVNFAKRMPQSPMLPRLLSILSLAIGLANSTLSPQNAAADSTHHVLLMPQAVWTGHSDSPQAGWVVLVGDDRIEAVGASTA